MTPSPAGHPRFDRPIPPDGYAWWYVDALSDDGRHGLALIAMLGSVFSPHYFAARQRGPTEPLEHCALNVGLYAPRSRRWAMTERGGAAIVRTPDRLQIGPSALAWDGEWLVITIDEKTAPFPTRLHGTVRVHTGPVTTHAFALDAAGRHHWTPFAPMARVEVDFESPRLKWSGAGYLDGNHGAEPLEKAFREWTWSRGEGPEGPVVFYDVERLDGSQHSLALAFAADRSVREFTPPPRAALPSPLWRMPRHTRADAGQAARVVKTLEDGPFYARSVVDTSLDGRRVRMVHESLSLSRFVQPWVQRLLPVRAPRARR